MLNRLHRVLVYLTLAAMVVSGTMAAPAEAKEDLSNASKAASADTAFPSVQDSLPGSALDDLSTNGGRAVASTYPDPSTSAPLGGGGIVNIPQAKTTPTVDGLCNEYTEAVSYAWADGGTTNNSKIYMMYNGAYLYVCIVGKYGSFNDQFGSLYLDPQGDGLSYTFAQQNDYAMHVSISDNSLSSFHGTNVANGYVPDTFIPALWNGKTFHNVDNGDESVEWAVDFGRLGIQPCQTVFRLGAYHHWFASVGNDYGWPSNQWFDQPRTWQPAILNASPCGDVRGSIAYVYKGNSTDASAYYSYLTSRGYTVTLVPLPVVQATDFSLFDAILIANDSGSLNQWGTPTLTSAQVAKITAGNKPIIGLGEGGYAFFGQLSLFIGWPRGWHGPQGTWAKASTAPPAFYTTPSAIPYPTQVYSPTSNSVGIYLQPTPLPTNVAPVALETPLNDHASLILQGCRLLWGGSGSPAQMTGEGKNLLVNSIEYMKAFQCAPEPPVDPTCFTINKTAVPASGASVSTNSVIEYSLTYTYSTKCAALPAGAQMVDTVPLNTLFVPNSGTDGVSPAPDGSLAWPVVATDVPITKKFRVFVTDTACNMNQPTIYNRSGFLIPNNMPIISNTTMHPVTCAPVTFPNNQPPYAEGEIQINPYPFLLGKPSKIQVTLSNSTGSPLPVTVDFMTSPDKFGIGLSFNVFATTNVTIPAHGTAIATGYLTPVASGHYCIQIRVSSPGIAPIYTQRNIDVTEELVGGQPDYLNFKVGNPTGSVANINLVVNNTCPGWTAQITIPPSGVLTAMAPGEVRDAQLQVTPPNPVTLGSGCHIDVQGWIGDQLIGGIRKLDVPPVGLPTDVNPPWEEPEISFIPDPPTAGVPGKVCVFLQNPTGAPRTVQVKFDWADFGAGVPFTNIGTATFTLPPNSGNNYCITWTPVTTGTNHRCILVTLKQPGYQDMRSQHNVNVLRQRVINLSTVQVPFVIGNPDFISHTLSIRTNLVGIDPYWQIKILTNPGDPPPDVLNPGQVIGLVLTFTPAMAASSGNAPLAQPVNPYFGDASMAQVQVLLDGEPYSGFTIQFANPSVYMPAIFNKTK